MFNLQIKILEQVFDSSNKWTIPFILPELNQKTGLDKYNIQSEMCTNLDETFYEFLIKLNTHPLPAHPEIQFDHCLKQELLNKYQIDVFSQNYIDFNLFFVNDIKRGDTLYKNKFERPHAFFISALKRIEFYSNKGFQDYRVLFFFEKPIVNNLNDNSILSQTDQYSLFALK